MDDLGPKGSLQKLIREILEYLVKNPEAKDTLEGIQQWWLEKGKNEFRPVEVEEALDVLVRSGWLTKRTPAQSIFGLNKERVEEIQQFLQSPRSS